MTTTRTVTLDHASYDELFALVKWQHDAPVDIDRVLDACAEIEQDIWDRTGHPDLSMATMTIGKGWDMEAEDENGVTFAVLRA